MNAFQIAHKITKETLKEGDNYQVNFSEALKLAWRYLKSKASNLDWMETIKVKPLISFVERIAFNKSNINRANFEMQYESEASKKKNFNTTKGYAL